MAVFECRRCQSLDSSPRAWALHLGPAARCPRCGTFRLTRLKEPDKIDKRLGGLLNLLERMAGGRLHHCRYCRIQFWDRRPLSAEIPPDRETVTNPPDTASSVTTRPDTANSGG